jgi:hypothetical protein
LKLTEALKTFNLLAAKNNFRVQRKGLTLAINEE